MKLVSAVYDSQPLNENTDATHKANPIEWWTEENKKKCDVHKCMRHVFKLIYS